MNEIKKWADIRYTFIRVFLSFCLSVFIFALLLIITLSLYPNVNMKIFYIVATIICSLCFVGLMYISEPKKKDIPKLEEKTIVQKTT